MLGEAAGAMIVLVLCGLVFPIALLLAAATFDAIIVVWALLQLWHDNLWPAVTGSLRRVTRLHHTPRLSPHW